jgi:hypothetical protein
MTQDEIIETARQAGFENCHISPIPTGKNLIFLEEFTKLVAAKEREACAKVCDETKANIWEFHPYAVREATNSVCVNLAAAIRARGQA